MKKALCLILIVVMLVGMLSYFPTKSFAVNGITQRLEKLQKKFPAGKYWNHYAATYDDLVGYLQINEWYERYSDTVTDHPCATHDGIIVPGYDCNNFDGGIQCCGFAKKLFYEIFGERESSSSLLRRYDKNISIGDYVSFEGGSHYAIVLSIIDSNSFTVAECNDPHNFCIIRWGRTCYKSQIDYYVHSNNYNAVYNDYAPATYTLDVNGLLDGSNSGSVGSYGTFDVYINGSRVANDVNDYYNSAVTAGSSYVITDIKPNDGYAFDGVSSGARTGTLNGNTDVRLKFHTIDAAGYVKKNSQPTDKVTYNGHTYLYYFNSPVTWYDAKKICEHLGGHLVTFSDRSEFTYVYAYSGRKPFWIGATDSKNEGTWKWVTGEKFSYSEWGKGEPNNSTGGEEGTENYASTTENFKWNDTCGCMKYPFVCEIDSIPVESIILLAGTETIFEGSTIRIDAIISPKDTTDAVKWTSSNESVVSIIEAETDPGRAEATVKGLSEGTATITVSAGGKSETCKVTVMHDPYIVTGSLPNAKQYKEYSTTLTGKGSGTLTWEIDSGSLPKGIALDADTGVLSGKPKQYGNFTFTVKVTGNNGFYLKQFALNVTENDRAIYLKDRSVTFANETHADLHFSIQNETDDARSTYIAVAEYTMDGDLITCRAEKNMTLSPGETPVDLSLVLSDPDNQIKVFTVDKENNEVLCDTIIVNYTSDWSAFDAPSGTKTVDKKWTYTLTENQDSYQSSIDGWTQNGFDWIKTSEQGTHYYADYPEGFDQENNLYKKYNHSAFLETSGKTNGIEWKKEVTSKEFVTYIYWHWTHNQYELSNGNYNVTISDKYCWDGGKEYYNFRAFASTADYGHIDPNGRNGGDAFYAWRGIVQDGSWWWYRFPVYKQTWARYEKLYHFTKVSSHESSDPVSEGNGISNIHNYIRWRKDLVVIADKQMPPLTQNFLIGDVNNDSIISMKDILMLRRTIAGDLELNDIEALCADVDGDGIVSMKDVLKLRKIIAGAES